MRKSLHARALVLPITLLFLLVLILAWTSADSHSGCFNYALDDAYIHMAIAKNLAQHGVWGVTQYQFSSSSSSLLWTLLLALVFRVTGVHDLTPLILNAVFATALLVAAGLQLKKAGYSDRSTTLLLIVFLLVIPVPALIFAGMEHMLQILLAVLFMCSASELLAREKAVNSDYTTLYILSALVASVRYEGLFMVLMVSVLLLFRRRVVPALLLIAAGALPLIIQGAVSAAHGWFWLPNSVLIKAGASDGGLWTVVRKILFRRSHIALLFAAHIFFLMIASLVLFLVRSEKGSGTWERPQIMSMIFVGTALLHIYFAQIGWFFRYEAYLVAIGFLTIATAASDYLPVAGNYRTLTTPRNVAILLVALLMTAPLVRRGYISLVDTPQAMGDRYCEHISMARFVRSYYNTSTIVINDVGTISYFTNARILDLYGLASREPVIFRRSANGYMAPDLRGWARRSSAKIAIVQYDWGEVRLRIPPDWITVGDWNLPRNVIFRTKTVRFFAVDPSEAGDLAAHLRAFRRELPPGVVQVLYQKQGRSPAHQHLRDSRY